MTMAQITEYLDKWQTRACLQGVQRYVVGFSGGLDSTVLLHALQGISTRPLLAVHVNHGLHVNAAGWQAHCAALCKAWQIDFEACRVEVNTEDGGLEAAARKARYAALSSFVQPGDALLTGHHQRDQAETLLLQLLRGSGVSGLAAMPASRDFGSGWQLRPLLELDRESLLVYAQAHSLNWLEDPSNTNEQLDRNFLRHQVMPDIRRRWPATDRLLARTARHSAEAAGLLDELALQDLANTESRAQQLSLSRLRQLSAPRRGNLLRYWLRSHGYEPPSTAQLQQIDRDLLAGREDAQPHFTQGDYELRRYREQLYLLEPLPPAPQSAELSWDGYSELLLPTGCGRLRAESANPPAEGLTPGDFHVRFLQGGERIRPAQNQYRRRLKTLFQEYGVPPWVRMRMPLIYHGQELVAVADAWLNADYLRNSGQGGWQPCWLDRPAGCPELVAQPRT